MAWFLSFLWKRPTDDCWHPADTTIDGEHPVVYVDRMRHANPAHEFHLTFFHEIPVELATSEAKSVAGAIPRQTLDVR